VELRKARLADIEVDEVSFVDKAANKRKFLFMKRDTSTSEEDKGGENLELLKAFKKDEDVIGALEGIEENLVKFEQALEKKLESEDISDEERELLMEKKAEYETLKNELEEGFEQLFLDKVASSSNGGADGKDNSDADDGVDSEEEMDTDETDGGEDENASTANPTGSGKGGKGSGGGVPQPLAGVKKKKKPAEDDNDDDSEDDSDEDDSEESGKKPTKKSDDSDEEFDDDENALLSQIQTELEKGEKLRAEVKDEIVPKGTK